VTGTASTLGLTSRERRSVALVFAVAGIACAIGWSLFEFLCDDAFIAFRYVSNRQLGFGYVWNAPPFLPVEGYTSFLWVLLLDGVWTVSGIEPPQAATGLSLLFALGSLAWVSALCVRLFPRREGWPVWGPVALVLLATVSNRTFLAWTSSGLETALFNFLVHGWLFVAWVGRGAPVARGIWLGSIAALMSLTRPDGYLFAAATPLVIALAQGPSLRTAMRPVAASVLPLLLVVAHVGWRRVSYGAWLPNTYFAKTAAAWPESGMRYLGAFALEYGLWLALPIVVAASFVAWRRGVRPARAGLVALACLLAHAAWYTVVVGGDHFEFRVYSQLVPLLGIAVLGSLWALRLRRDIALATFALFLLMGWVIPWTHWWKTRDLDQRSQTHLLFTPVAADLPFPLRPIGAAWDDLERWLVRRHVGLRHQEHRVLHEHLGRVLPSREQGARWLADEENPVVVAVSVGVVGWVFPNAHVIDPLGLNDYVVARTPLAVGAPRAMAHDRRPPPGYLDAFRPGLRIGADFQMMKTEREAPLHDAEIREIERRYRAALGSEP
jgi:arabinofuranosyltransferase